MYSNSTSRSTRSAESLRADLRRIAGECLSGLGPGKVRDNPVRLMLLIGAIVSTVSVIFSAKHVTGFNVTVTLLICLILMETIVAHALVKLHIGVLANEMAPDSNESRARKLVNGAEHLVPADALRDGDLVLCETGEVVPADGVILQGTAIIDESAMTGQSPPVLRESGGERNEVFGKTTVLGGRIIVSVTAKERKVVIDPVASAVERIKYQMASDEREMAVPLWLLVVGFSVAFVALPFLTGDRINSAEYFMKALMKTPAVISILVCALPLTAAELLNTAALSAVSRLVRKKIIPASMNAVEISGLVDVLLLDEKEVIAFNRQSAKGSVMSNVAVSDDDCDGSDYQSAVRSFPSEKIHELGLRTVLSADSDRGEEFAAAIGAVSCLSGGRPENKLATIQSERSSGAIVAVVGDHDDIAPLAREANLCFIVDGGAEVPDGNPNSIGLNGRPNRLINAIETGRRLNEVQKRLTHFAVGVTASMSLLALFPLISTIYGGRREVVETIPWLNVLGLFSPHSVILDMSIFTVISFVSVAAIAARSLYASGIRSRLLLKVGPSLFVTAGFVAPIVAVKLIDLTVVALRFI